MDRLMKVTEISEIPEAYRETPIGALLQYHNLGTPFQTYSQAQLLVGMCMDNRKQLRIPENFAYIIRSGGGNLRYSEFKVSYAIAIGGVQAIALLAHDQCGMVKLASRKADFIRGLVERAGWDQERATEHFDAFAPLFAIENEIDFAASEAKRLRLRYPGVLIVPLLYRLEDNLLYLINEGERD